MNKEILEFDAKIQNMEIGNLHLTDGINCPKCRNRGYIAEVQETELGYYLFAKWCECMPKRRLFDVMKTSGLGDLLKIYKLANYQCNEDWQQGIYDKAISFIDKPTNCFYIGGQIGCVDCDTEFFNGKEWKKISEYNENDFVLQYNENGVAELVKPINYIKEKCDTLNYVKTKYGIDMCVCDNHNVVYKTSKGHIAKIKFSDLKERHNKTIQGFYGKFITTFDYNGKGIDLTDDEIKLFCAVICDGSYHYNLKSENAKTYNKARFHIKKERKKQELRKLFIDGNFDWQERESATKGYTDFYVMTPYRLKTFTEDWYNCSNHQLKIICDNILKWDGCESRGRKSFSSRDKKVIDFVQFAFASQGYRTSIRIDNRVGRTRIIENKEYIDKKITYELHISQGNNLITMTANHSKKTEIVDYQTKDGFKYCFTVPSHIWVMRRNGNILITGNCGKSHICTAIVGELVKKGETNVKYVVWDSITTMLKQSKFEDADAYNEELSELKNAKILFIDDFFKNNVSATDIKNAFDILNYRYNLARSEKEDNYITIISSEKLITEILQIDEAIGSRIVELAKNYVLTIPKDINKNYRIKGVI